ncbi:hypothetical protein RND71_011408 [Anisodus tanguticus]|uniref:Uncharacterized protein n=1 Tax=Anisodus tanguticus TaxID=243964 RepID=A0AAE1VKW1_9SOLA|nr:hypothetical protein RND71_011408 [Anisodus tanguticus]
MGRDKYKTLLLLLLTIVLLKTVNVQEVEECNGTASIGECLADGDEFLMESQTTTKLIAARPVNTLSYKSLQGSSICNENSTLVASGAENVEQRSCGDFNRCKHYPNK